MRTKRALSRSARIVERAAAAMPAGVVVSAAATRVAAAMLTHSRVIRSPSSEPMSDHAR